jgi:Na+-translocating ferredoxin:NAD+ oxidoreductase RnfE subunit
MAPAIAGTHTFADAILFSIIGSISLVSLSYLVPVLHERFGKRLATQFSLVIAALFVSFAAVWIRWLFPFTYESTKVFLWLIPLSSIVAIPVYREEFGSYQHKADASLALQYSIGILLYGLLREALADGAISLPSADSRFGIRFFAQGSTPLRFLSLPSGALLLLGTLIALERKILSLMRKKGSR